MTGWTSGMVKPSSRSSASCWPSQVSATARQLTAAYSTGTASSHPVTMAHRVPRARKIRSSRVATTNHVSRAGVKARPPSRAVRAVTASTSRFPAASMAQPVRKWVQNRVPRRWGRACMAPTDRVCIR